MLAAVASIADAEESRAGHMGARQKTFFSERTVFHWKHESLLWKHDTLYGHHVQHRGVAGGG